MRKPTQEPKIKSLSLARNLISERGPFRYYPTKQAQSDLEGRLGYGTSQS